MDTHLREYEMLAKIRCVQYTSTDVNQCQAPPPQPSVLNHTGDEKILTTQSIQAGKWHGEDAGHSNRENLPIAGEDHATARHGRFCHLTTRPFHLKCISIALFLY